MEKVSLAEAARQLSLSLKTLRKYIDFPQDSELRLRANRKINGHFRVASDELNRWAHVYRKSH